MLLEYRQGFGVLRATKRRYQYYGISDVEIRIARGQALILVDDGCWRRQGYDSQRPAVLVAHAFQVVVVLLVYGKIDILRVTTKRADDGRRIHKPRQVVNVAVGVVAGNSLFEPKNVRPPQVLA